MKNPITTINDDALAYMKTLDDNSVDLIFTDPPYALGSKIIIQNNGKPEYKKAVDFMNKWDQPGGVFWEEWFAEAKRVLKYGGHCLMFGMDRQLWFNCYYANLAGFTQKQSLYWYFICNDIQTELLTKRGWLKHTEIKKEDIVLTFNTNTGKSEWQNIEDTHLYDVDNLDMVRFVNRDIDQFVTPNHRILHQTRTNPRYPFGSWQYAQAETFLNQKSPLIKLPLAFENLEGSEQYGEKLCHLIGWVLTDGYYQKGDNSIRISQSSTNITKVEKIRDLFLSLQIDFKEYPREREYTYKGITKTHIEHVFYFNDETSVWIKDLFPDKKPTWDLLNMSFEERYNLFLGMMAGDGGFKMVNDYTDIYEALESTENFNGTFTKNKDTANFMQALASSLGFSTSLNEYTNKTTVNISWKQTTGIQQAKGKIFTEKYTGKVWSITTKNSNYCIRRNGKVSFTGNSNFPKASDLSKNLAKNLGENVTEFGGIITAGNDGRKAKLRSGKEKIYKKQELITPLAQKYNGIKYSVAPLKQTNETIMVFQKPYKTGSCLHDVLALENGDNTITCGGVDIERNRVPTEEKLGRNNNARTEGTSYIVQKETMRIDNSTNGRFPAQTYIDSGASEIIDRQSGVLKSGGGNKSNRNSKSAFGGGASCDNYKVADSGGASRILHKCDYEAGDYDLYHYCSKVSKKERTLGVEGYILRSKTPQNIINEIKKVLDIAQ